MRRTRNIFHYAKAVTPQEGIPWPDVPIDHLIEGSVIVGRHAGKIVWHSCVQCGTARWNKIKAHPKYLASSYRELWKNHRAAARHVILTQWTVDGENGPEIRRGTVAAAPPGARGKFAPHKFGGVEVEE